MKKHEVRKFCYIHAFNIEILVIRISAQLSSGVSRGYSCRGLEHPPKAKECS